MTEEPDEFYCPVCIKWKPMTINPVVILGRLTCPVHKWSELQESQDRRVSWAAGHGWNDLNEFETGFAPVFEDIVLKEIDGKID